jgi:hypothetical protein
MPVNGDGRIAVWRLEPPLPPPVVAKSALSESVASSAAGGASPPAAARLLVDLPAALPRTVLQPSDAPADSLAPVALFPPTVAIAVFSDASVMASDSPVGGEPYIATQ